LRFLKIPTTTEDETLKLIHWLVRTTRPRHILEMGCWLGHTSLMMARAYKKANIFAVDSFKWQMWMNNFLVIKNGQNFMQVNENFQDKFKENVKPLIQTKRIIPVEWCNETITHLPIQFNNEVTFDLVYLDFTRDSDELEKYWSLLKKCFIPNKTLIILNSLCFDLLKFLNAHARELECF